MLPEENPKDVPCFREEGVSEPYRTQAAGWGVTQSC